MSHGLKLFFSAMFAIITLTIFAATLLYYKALIKLDEQNRLKNASATELVFPTPQIS